ncbi:hypothetical protein DFH06DRAFT_1327455 [Mycena polygramma]|nr:hypothetical protein DFH06DRAFT_1327455 [Mycena polygramma]
MTLIVRREYTTGAFAVDDKLAPKENYIIKQPVFFGAAHQDYVCVANVAIVGMQTSCRNLTVKDYQTDHWVQLAAPDKVNADLLEYIENN